LLRLTEQNDAGEDAFVAELRRDFAEAVLRLIAFGLNERARSTYDKGTRGWQEAVDWIRHMREALASFQRDVSPQEVRTRWFPQLCVLTRHRVFI
jgi:hypothetical protein